MSLSTKREDSHDPMETEPRKRRSSRLNRKHLGSYSKRSSTSKEDTETISMKDERQRHNEQSRGSI
jgi:hypothetical protein